ncbi:MAG: helix-turn-helix domain-containing protein [Treponema sp.]|nr:helix-turn-helix domain-containing protein [Treponema sp.]
MSIISRREIEPLLLKARQVLRFYAMATDTAVAVLDSSGHPVDESCSAGILRFCAFCKKHHPDSENSGTGNSDSGSPDSEKPAGEEYPCAKMHINAIREARQSGGVYIYLCDLGFLFWISPLIAAGHLAGALIAGGVLGIDRQKAAARLKFLAGEEFTEEEILLVKEKKIDEVKSLAQTLLLCAEHIARNTDDYRETLKRLGEQEEGLSQQFHLIRADEDAPPPSYPLDRERTFLAALRRGDNDAGRKLLGELLENILVSSHHNFESMKLRAIELVVILSREAVTPDKSEDNIILETNNRYIKRIQEAKNPEELTDILYLIVDRMAGRIFSFQGIRHASALRKAERFIWENYTRKICLKEIAEASGLSAPYFSSIFKEEMGENLSTYLNRLRVERAATMLIESNMSLCEIAGVCGFEDQSWFSKIFKSYTGKSPGKYREQGEGAFLAVRESSGHEEIG